MSVSPLGWRQANQSKEPGSQSGLRVQLKEAAKGSGNRGNRLCASCLIVLLEFLGKINGSVEVLVALYPPWVACSDAVNLSHFEVP